MHKHEARESVTLVNKGEKIFGIFHRPLVKAPYPAVLMCHGLAGHKAGRFRVYVELAEQLSAHGIGVLRIDFRGSGDSEGDFAAMTLKGEVSDALLGLNWLRNEADVDEKRIGLFGRSLGGAVAVITAAEYDHCKSLALWCAIYSGDQWHDKWIMVKSNDGHPEHLAALKTFNGQMAGVPFFEELFSMRLKPFLKKLNDTPLLNIHGLKDDIVLTSHAEAYKEERKVSAAPSKFIILSETDHDFSHHHDRKKAIKETCQWFKETL